ncbi:hypothetical protein [Mucilaginibacter sp. dw_454]|uniref:hypothetical protein n=1 Tax=Mucilaginibacter sp. dw_454 TaxID=2720079 RepID=UPI001BD38A60|nr:hypothetical protein [Mucilaginibacter sp. dw_454]
MKYLPLGIILLCLAACSSPSKKFAATNSVTDTDTAKNKNADAPVITTYRFMHHEGKDTTRVEFTAINNRVQGIMDWFPHQKKGHGGVIEGMLKNDTLHATWSFAVGPTGLDKDTMKVDFLLKSSKELLQKPMIVNEKTGRLQTDEKAGYTLAYKPSARHLVGN